MSSISDLPLPLLRIAAEIMEAETYLPPEPEPDTIEHARWRDRRNTIGSLDAERMHEILYNAFHYIDISETVSAGDIAARLGDILNVEELARMLFSDLIVKDPNAFPVLYKQVARNWALDKKDPVSWFNGTPVAELFDIEFSISVPEEARFAGTWIVAPPGRGKTTLLRSLFVDDIDKPASIIVMDSKGEFLEPIMMMECLKDRLVVIDPEIELALNPFSKGLNTLELLEYLLSSLLKAELTPKQANLFRSCIQATLLHPRPSIPTFRKIMKDGVDFSVPPELADFFQNEFPTKTYSDTRQEIQWRLRLLLDNTRIGKMFSAEESRLDIAELMDDQRVILINNSKALLGDDGAEFFGRFFLALILGAAQKRALRSQKTPCYVYIDEAQSVIKRDEKITTILDECRSQRIALILAHQRCGQLDPPVLDAVSNCAVRYANSDDDAQLLAPKLRTTADRLRSLKRGQFQCYVRDLGSFRITVEKPTMPKSMTHDEAAEIWLRMEEEYGLQQVSSQNIVEHSDTSIEENGTKASKDW